jgi:hypothetical protein
MIIQKRSRNINYLSIINLNNLGQNIFVLILFLSLALPTIITPIKMALLGILALFVLITSLKHKKLEINKELFLITLFFSTLGLVYSTYGSVADNPGATRTMTVMVIYPLLFLSLSIFFSQINDFIKIKKALIFGSFLVVLVQMSFLLSAYGVFPEVIAGFFRDLHPGMAVLHVMEGSFLFTLPNVSSLIFLIPFLLSYVLLSEKKNTKLLILLLIMFCLILLTGRRAFFVSIAFSLIFLLFASWYLSKNLKSNIFKKLIKTGLVLIGLIVVLIVSLEVDIEVYVNDFMSIFDFSTNDSNLERVYQFRSLLEGIATAPLFGHGAGAAAEYIRSGEQPWAYELSYVAFIFHYGILGFMVYCTGIVYILISLLKICKDKMVSKDIKVFIASFLTGFVAFLVANATNPYLGKFDYMWVVFIPVMIINAYKIEKRKQIAKDI